MKNILFITWDGPQTSYMEGLFMPIFFEIQKENNYRFHVIQFSWGTEERIAITRQKADELNIKYSFKKIHRKPHALIGSLFTVAEGVIFIKKYLKNNSIDILMPRSIMPAIMVNRLFTKNYKILFDADGLPIEERVDFLGLKKNSLIYNIYKKEERLILIKAYAIITRTAAAIDFHLNAIGKQHRDKFFVVVNGRDTTFFKHNINVSQKIREGFNINKETKVFIYSGSLGPQYGWEIMIKIFKRYLQINHNSIFLILTGNEAFAKKRIPLALQNHIIVKSLPFEEIPKYLSVGDIAFAIREPKLSMQGVAPIKLGEYLLIGIPTIASSGIGDTESLLKDKNFCFLYQHDAKDSVENAIKFIEKSGEFDKVDIQNFGIDNFSMKISTSRYKIALDYCS
ncbi:glycosyltransferase [Flavobacterium sp.]|jgi:glycosyltransferase involved in cell wall biosynthesis|uniref:glycosyltransferase n=1 Tax=Flavobacterium sp. TaxID=239 RepID=UPI0037C088BE